MRAGPRHAGQGAHPDWTSSSLGGGPVTSHALGPTEGRRQFSPHRASRVPFLSYCHGPWRDWTVPSWEGSLGWGQHRRESEQCAAQWTPKLTWTHARLQSLHWDPHGPSLPGGCSTLLSLGRKDAAGKRYLCVGTSPQLTHPSGWACQPSGGTSTGSPAH